MFGNLSDGLVLILTAILIAWWLCVSEPTYLKSVELKYESQISAVLTIIFVPFGVVILIWLLSLYF